MSDQQQLFKSPSDLNMNSYNFPTSMFIYHILSGSGSFWKLMVCMPSSFLVQVSGLYSLGQEITVERSVGKLKVKLTLPIYYEQGKPYCYGLLKFTQPRVDRDLLEISLFLLPMARGNLTVLNDLLKLFSEHAIKLPLSQVPQVPFRREAYSRGRGRGSRGRSQPAASATKGEANTNYLALPKIKEEFHNVETIDLVDEGRVDTQRSDIQGSVPTENNKTTVRYIPASGLQGTLTNVPLNPNTSGLNYVFPSKSNGLPEASSFLSASTSEINLLDPSSQMNQEEQTPLTIRNTFDRCQFLVSNNGQYQHSNTNEQKASARQTNNNLLTNSIGVSRTTQNVSANSQNLRYEASKPVPTSIPVMQATKNALTNSIGIPEQSLRFLTNSQNLQYSQANMIAPSVPVINTQHSYQNQPPIATYPQIVSGYAQNSQQFNYQNPAYRHWSTSNLQTVGGHTMDMRGEFQSSTVSSTESHHSTAQSFNPNNYSGCMPSCSNIKAEQLPTFEEAVSSLTPRNTYTNVLSGYNRDNISLESGFRVNDQYALNEGLNQQRMFVRNDSLSHGLGRVNGDIKPNIYYQVHSGVNGTTFVNRSLQNQTFNGNNQFPNLGFNQPNSHHLYFSNNTNQQTVPNMRFQNIQSNHPTVINNSCEGKLVTDSKKENKQNIGHVNCSSNIPSLPNTMKTIVPNKTVEDFLEQRADLSADVNNANFDETTDYEDSSEPVLVIDEQRAFGNPDEDTNTLNQDLPHQGLDGN